MTTNDFPHQEIRETLEKALQQIVTTQDQVSSLESHLQQIKSQVDLSLAAIDSVLKQLEQSEETAEKVKTHVAASLDEMFSQLSQIVNGAREQMMRQESPAAAMLETSAGGIQEEPSTELRSEPQTMAEEHTTELLGGHEAGQRASDSLDEMISSIDQANGALQGTATAVEMQSETRENAGVDGVSVGTSTQPEIPVSPKSQDAPEQHTGPGNLGSLSELLAKARATSGDTVDGPTELTSMVEEDPEAVSELLQNMSGPIVAQ